MQFLQLVILVSLLAAINAFTMQPAVRNNKIHTNQRQSNKLLMINEPHGGKLINTMVHDNAKKNEIISSCDFEVDLDERQLCDVELLMQGGFSPLSGYMDESNYNSVVDDLKLTTGDIFGLPVVYDTNDPRVEVGKKILLRYNRIPIATLEVSSKYIPNKAKEAKACYGTTSIEHPAVSMITTERGKYYCGGKITGLNVPIREFPWYIYNDSNIINIETNRILINYI